MNASLRTQLRDQSLILVAGLFVFFVGLGAPRLWDEDETEYSGCAREMMQSGDWVAPTFNHHLWAEKPVFVYWLMMGSFQLFGTTEFAARFPSAVFALSTSLLTYHLGRVLFRREVGLWAGLILASSVIFVVVGRAATLDATMIFFTTLALLAFCVTAHIGPRGHARDGSNVNRPTLGPQSLAGSAGQPRTAPDAASRFRAVLPQTWLGFAAVYVPLGMAMLVKGPIGVVMPMTGIGLYVLLAGQDRATARKGSAAQGSTARRPMHSIRQIDARSSASHRGRLSRGALGTAAFHAGGDRTDHLLAVVRLGRNSHGRRVLASFLLGPQCPIPAAFQPRASRFDLLLFGGCAYRAIPLDIGCVDGIGGRRPTNSP